MTWIVLNYCLDEEKSFLYKRRIWGEMCLKIAERSNSTKSTFATEKPTKTEENFLRQEKFPLRSLRVIFLPPSKVYKTNTSAWEKSFLSTWCVNHWTCGNSIFRKVESWLTPNVNKTEHWVNHLGWVCQFQFHLPVLWIIFERGKRTDIA